MHEAKLVEAMTVQEAPPSPAQRQPPPEMAELLATWQLVMRSRAELDEKIAPPDTVAVLPEIVLLSIQTFWDPMEKIWSGRPKGCRVA